MENMKIIWEKYKKYRLVVGLVLFMILMVFVADDTRKSREEIIYPESLDLVAATVEGEEITLRDFAIYVAHQEMEVQKQAEVYNPDNTHQYWNVHTDRGFISQVARDEAMTMAIHDELFYQLSKEYDLSLSEEERKILNNKAEDFWYDLTDDDKHLRLGITKEEAYASMEKIAIAQKGQSIYAGMNGVKYEDYNFSEEVFLEFLENYNYTVDDSVLGRIDFGDVTLTH